MALYEFNGKVPLVGEGTWIASSSEIIGDVTIGKNCWIGPCAVIRGDFGSITIDDETAIEDGVVIHTPASVSIGTWVTIGHLAMIHGSSVGDYAVVGMNSTLGDNTQVGSWSIVASIHCSKRTRSYRRISSMEEFLALKRGISRIHTGTSCSRGNRCTASS
jgi:carbonic anhydrase/acetyltransferase-like protein (isoleucine patch superfamily)